MRRRIEGPWRLAAREVLFRILGRHRQGNEPNILVHCFPRSGSTWILNTLSSHPRVRQMTRPFMTMTHSRHRRHMPDLARAAGAAAGDHVFWNWVHFPDEDEERLRFVAERILGGDWFVYPAINFWAPYFQRRTERLAFQITHATSLIEWFDRTFDVHTALLLRHPIAAALSNIAKDFRDESEDFLRHEWFVDTQLTGEQVDFARKILARGSPVASLVLDWTLRMLVPVRAIESGGHSDWTRITYEQTVYQPREVVELFSRRFGLPDVAAMMRQVKRPSRTVSKTTIDRTGDPGYLVRRWRDRIGKDEERDLVGIPNGFGIEVYTPGRIVAAATYLNGWEPPPELR